MMDPGLLYLAREQWYGGSFDPSATQALPYVSRRQSGFDPASGNPFADWSIQLFRRIQDKFAFNSEQLLWLKMVLIRCDIPLSEPLKQSHVERVQLSEQLDDSLIGDLLDRQLMPRQGYCRPDFVLKRYRVKQTFNSLYLNIKENVHVINYGGPEDRQMVTQVIDLHELSPTSQRTRGDKKFVKKDTKGTKERLKGRLSGSRSTKESGSVKAISFKVKPKEVKQLQNFGQPLKLPLKIEPSKDASKMLSDSEEKGKAFKHRDILSESTKDGSPSRDRSTKIDVVTKRSQLSRGSSEKHNSSKHRGKDSKHVSRSLKTGKKRKHHSSSKPGLQILRSRPPSSESDKGQLTLDSPSPGLVSLTPDKKLDADADKKLLVPNDEKSSSPRSQPSLRRELNLEKETLRERNSGRKSSERKRVHDYGGTSCTTSKKKTRWSSRSPRLKTSRDNSHSPNHQSKAISINCGSESVVVSDDGKSVNGPKSPHCLSSLFSPLELEKESSQKRNSRRRSSERQKLHDHSGSSSSTSKKRRSSSSSHRSKSTRSIASVSPPIKSEKESSHKRKSSRKSSQRRKAHDHSGKSSSTFKKDESLSSSRRLKSTRDKSSSPSHHSSVRRTRKLHLRDRRSGRKKVIGDGSSHSSRRRRNSSSRRSTSATCEMIEITSPLRRVRSVYRSSSRERQKPNSVGKKNGKITSAGTVGEKDQIHNIVGPLVTGNKEQPKESSYERKCWEPPVQKCWGYSGVVPGGITPSAVIPGITASTVIPLPVPSMVLMPPPIPWNMPPPFTMPPPPPSFHLNQPVPPATNYPTADNTITANFQPVEVILNHNPSNLISISTVELGNNGNEEKPSGECGQMSSGETGKNSVTEELVDKIVTTATWSNHPFLTVLKKFGDPRRTLMLIAVNEPRLLDRILDILRSQTFDDIWTSEIIQEIEAKKSLISLRRQKA